MKKVRNIVVIVLSVICVGILVFLLWNLRSTEESAQEIIPEVQPEPMSEQSVSDSDVSGNQRREQCRSYGIAGEGRK